MRSFAATCSLRSGSASSGTSPALMRRASSAASSRLSNKLLLASSSRRAIASAFIATRVRNFIRWSSSVGRSSPARNSNTASISSGAVGRSGTFDQVEELVFHLRRHPAQHRVLDAAVYAGEMSAALRQATDSPLDVAEHLPPVEVGLGDLAPGQRVVGLEVQVEAGEAAQPALVAAEAPRSNKRPAHVLARVGQVRKLPVEDIGQPALRHRNVAEPEVPVADDVGDGLGPMLAQPPKAVLDRWMWLIDRVELVLKALEDVTGREKRQPLGRDRMDLGELLSEIDIEARRWITHDAPADGLALHELHRERLAAAELAQVGDGPGHLDAGLERGLEHLELVLQREGSLVDHPPAGAAHE